MNRKENSARGTMYIFWSIAIILCLLMVMFSLLFSSCVKGSDTRLSAPTAEPQGTTPVEQQPDGTTTPDETPAVTEPPVSSSVLTQTDDAGQGYIDRMTFLGDSTTYGIVVYGKDFVSEGENTKQVWTPASGTLTLAYWETATIVYPETGAEISIVNAVTEKQPDILVITLGVNGVSFMDESSFTSSYTNLVKAVQAASPNTKIICNSIYPVESSYSNTDNGISNAGIDAANGWIKAVAEATGAKYCDTASALKDASGCLPSEYGNGDGIHLSTEGFRVVFEYLRTHAYA